MTTPKPPTNDTADTPDTEIAERITNALIVKGVSVHRLSDESGISYPTLRRSLKGGRSLTFAEFTKIARALNLQPSSLLPDTLAARSAA
jgi:transcriptional regulator with XRE-family HTH domain